MNDEGQERLTAGFRRPNERKLRDDDPYADMRAYFAYWNAKHIMDRRQPQRSHGVYEDARRKYRSE